MRDARSKLRGLKSKVRIRIWMSIILATGAGAVLPVKREERVEVEERGVEIRNTFASDN